MNRNLFLFFVLLAMPVSSEGDPCKAFLARWQWPVESEAESTDFELPKDFSGIPFLHYQNASLDSGLDLTPGKGRTVKLRKFVLQRKGAETGAKIYAHIALLNGHIIGAWLSTDAPIAPGIASVRDRDFGHDF